MVQSGSKPGNGKIGRDLPHERERSASKCGFHPCRTCASSNLAFPRGGCRRSVRESLLCGPRNREEEGRANAAMLERKQDVGRRRLDDLIMWGESHVRMSFANGGWPLGTMSPPVWKNLKERWVDMLEDSLDDEQTVDRVR